MAIIAVLAAVAVPNFLEAQTRAKVTRTYSDMRTIVIGIRAYETDANTYPHYDLGRKGMFGCFILDELQAASRGPAHPTAGVGVGRGRDRIGLHNGAGTLDNVSS